MNKTQRTFAKGTVAYMTVSRMVDIEHYGEPPLYTITVTEDGSSIPAIAIDDKSVTFEYDADRNYSDKLWETLGLILPEQHE